MATGLIQQVQINDGDINSIAPTVYGVCNTAANLAAKTVSIDGFELITGTTIYIKFTNNNTASSPTLNVSNTGAKLIMLADGNSSGIDDATTGWFSNSVLMLTYDGSDWIRGMGYNNSIEYDSVTKAEIEIGENTTGKLISAKVFKDVLDDALADIDISNLSGSIEVAGRTWNLGDTITKTNLLSDLELSNALHFIGKVASNSTHTPSDESNEVPTIIGLSGYVPVAGDVVIDAQNSREYVYTTANSWELLGQDASEVYSLSVNANERITSITQASDRTITVSKTTISTLPILYGGTGTTSFDADEVILSSNPSAEQEMTLISRAYKDIAYANAILNSTNYFVTERYIYYGLPTINNAHDYTSSTELYAPISAGEANHILISSGGTSAPVWSAVATLESHATTSNTDAYDTLSLGNSNTLTSIGPHSQGQIRLYSNGSTYTDIMSQSGSSETFYLPAYQGDMYAVHAPSNQSVGSPTQPVFVNTNGQVQALTFAPNRLYYSTEADSGQSTSSSFEATNHYSTDLTLAINDADTNYTGNRPDYNLYVNGSTYFNGNVIHNGITYFSNPSTNDITNGTAFYINNDAEGYLSNLKVDKIKLDSDTISFYQNNKATGTCYATVQVTDATHMYLHLSTNASTNIFDFNGSLIPSVPNSYDIGSDTIRWKDIYLQGNLIMQDIGNASSSYPAQGNKITWSGGGDSAEIYYQVDSANNGCLYINTANDESCLIALSYSDTAMAYFNNSTPSFYPETTNSGSLGLATKRWGALYVGSSDTYGDPYQPIYWNDGLPDIAYPIQYFTWSIANGTAGVTLTGNNIFKDNTYGVTIVVTSGEEYLNAPLTWTSSTNPDTFTINSTSAVSGNVSGYAIVARGVDITSSLTSSTASSSGGSSNNNNNNNEPGGGGNESGGDEPSGSNDEPNGEESGDNPSSGENEPEEP